MLKWILLAVLLIIAGQALFSLLMGSDQPPVEPVDLIATFRGDKARIAAVSELLRKGTSRHLVIPGASEKAFGGWERKYDFPSSTKNMTPDSPGASTFEDALLAAEVIRENGFDSVMLVTSDYHLPRAWLLLKALTFGNGVKIYSVGVENGENPPGIWHRVKLTYNEMVKFWGSLVEMAWFKITGKLLYKNQRAAKTVKWLKAHLLFEVKGKRILAQRR